MCYTPGNLASTDTSGKNKGVFVSEIRLYMTVWVILSDSFLLLTLSKQIAVLFHV